MNTIKYSACLLFLILIIACQKDTESISGLKWGEVSNGIRISVGLEKNHISKGDEIFANVIMENISAEDISYSVISMFNLYNENEILSYITYFDVMAEDLEALYASSKSHPTVDLNLNKNSQKKLKLDLIKLGWVRPQDSRPPYMEFYELIAKGHYNLTLEIEIFLVNSPNIFISSNAVDLFID